MATTVLGISAFYHDSAAAIVCDGEIVAAAQEERFSRVKHDPRLPENAINYCLEEAFIEAEELDGVVFYDNPILTWDRVVESCLATGRADGTQFAKAATSLLGHKLWIGKHIEQTIGSLGKAGRLLFCEHHLSHAASAFYPSPFESTAILTIDGVGEWTTTAIGQGEGGTCQLLKEIHYPHSLGLLYSAFTYFCGFRVNSGEYKLMGLAPYGKPRYVDTIRNELIDIRADGSFRLNLEYFTYLDEFSMTGAGFEKIFGGPRREPESRISRREMDLAASIQQVTEEIVILLAQHAREITQSENLVLAGGVALNCVANGKLLKESIFENVWIQPAAGDAGGALGAALYTSSQYFGCARPKPNSKADSQQGSFLGPEYSDREILAFLDRKSIPYQQVSDAEERQTRIAQALADGKIVGFATGRMEFGPRALGARSILGNPQNTDTQSTMNLRTKYRESFRPFAPAVLDEELTEYFDLDQSSPYMLLVAPVVEERQLDMPEVDTDDLLKIVNLPRSDIPAVTHVNYSARVQTVHKATNPEFHSIISKFRDLTGCSVVVNTSFNVRGEPIVCSPHDAYLCFMRTEMDLLVMENYVLEKKEQPKLENDEDWRSAYELD